VLQGAPAAGEQGEPAFAQAAQRALEGVAGASVDIQFPPVSSAGRLTGMQMPAPSQPGREGRQVGCGGPVEGGQGMGAQAWQYVIPQNDAPCRFCACRLSEVMGQAHGRAPSCVVIGCATLGLVSQRVLPKRVGA
jgi:hypothetical protein